jgi:hypothetical protein
MKQAAAGLPVVLEHEVPPYGRQAQFSMTVNCIERPGFHYHAALRRQSAVDMTTAQACSRTRIQCWTPVSLSAADMLLAG